MDAFFIALFLLLPIALALYLCWRAWQMGYNGQPELARQWLRRPPPGIEQCALPFARRDLALAAGCAVFVALVLAKPTRFGWWLLVALAFAAAYQGYTWYALDRLKKKAVVA
jgi:hypothetical protein